LEEKKMAAFDQRKQREENRKFNKQVVELKKHEKAENTRQNIADGAKMGRSSSSSSSAGGSARGKGDRDLPEKSFKRQALVRRVTIG
jgi:hypothetical protein